MRPSSSPSDGLFDGVLGRGGAADEVRDGAWLRALLDVEVALAMACAAAGLVPPAAAAAISAACRDPSAYDLGLLGRQAAAEGNPVVPLVRSIEGLAGPDAAPFVHFGATSQDVLDSAMLLVARRALGHVLTDLRAAAGAAAGLAAAHRDTAMVGRTLLQQALPTTFGLKAAGWALALDHAAAQLDRIDTALPVQLGGAVGTLAVYGERAPVVLTELASVLGLQVPVLPWHTARGPVADLAGALGAACGAVGKVGLDVCLLAQNEVGEVREGVAGRGGSSALPHKRNPVAAVAARAAAFRAPGLVATLLSAMAQEHERAAGAWHAEWETLGDLLRATGSGAAWLRDCLESLEVDSEQMAHHLGVAANELVAEAVAVALAPQLGRTAAHALVAAAVARTRTRASTLLTELAADPGCPLDDAQLSRLTTPSTGQAGQLVDRALASRTTDKEQP